MSSLGSAAQLSSTKGALRRVPPRVIARASSDLPVPDGPVSSTGLSAWAASEASSSTVASAGERPTSSGQGKRLRMRAVASVAWDCARCRARATSRASVGAMARAVVPTMRAASR